MFTENRVGTFVLCSASPEPFQAFVPHPLPPNPSLNSGLFVPTTTTALAHLQKLGIVREMTGRQRNRLFCTKNIRTS
jgi:hypothetical protein